MPIFVGSAQVQKMYIGSAEISAAANSGSNVLGPAGSFPGITNSSLYLPLKTSIIPSRGSSTPTFTRATAAWSFDNEGKLNLNIPSGCVRFKGGRFVSNLVTGASETFNTSAWAAVVLTKQANSITSDASVDFQNLKQNVVNSYLTGHTIQFGLRVQYVSQQYVQLSFATAVIGSGQYCNFDLLNGIYNATGCTAGMTQVSPGVFDIWINPVATASASGGPVIVFTNSLTSARYDAFAGGAGKVIGLLRAWVNNVSGQSDQTPSEYVSVGVLSSPYHGAGVDGCKWFPTNKDGSAIPSSTLEGYFAEPSRTNNCLWNRDLTNVAWTNTNITASKTATGLDNVSNSATRLTAAAADATITQLLTAATGTRTLSAYIKRVSGTGTISLTRNGGTGWTDITSSLVTGSWVLVKMTSDVGANPTVGIKMGTSGDVIDVDCVQDENGAWATSPILTTTTAVTRNADVLSYASALTNNNFSALASVSFDDVSNISDRRAFQVYQDASNYWFLSMVNVTDTRYTSVIAAAFTTVIKTSTAITKGAVQKLIATASSTTGKRVTRNGLSVVSDANTSNVNVSDLNIGGSGGLSGSIREIHIWATALTDEQIKQVTS